MAAITSHRLQLARATSAPERFFAAYRPRYFRRKELTSKTGERGGGNKSAGRQVFISVEGANRQEFALRSHGEMEKSGDGLASGQATR